MATQEFVTTLPDAVSYVLEGIVDETEVTERDALIALAAYAKGYRDSQESIPDPEPELVSRRRKR